MAKNTTSKKSWPKRIASAVWRALLWTFRGLILALRFLGWLGGILFLVLLILFLWFFGIPDFDALSKMPDRVNALEQRISYQAEQIRLLQHQLSEMTVIIDQQSSEITSLMDALLKQDLSEPNAAPVIEPSKANSEQPVPMPSTEKLSTRSSASGEFIQAVQQYWSWWYLLALIPFLFLLGRKTSLGNAYATPGYAMSERFEKRSAA